MMKYLIIILFFTIHCGSHIVYDVSKELDNQRDDVSIGQAGELRIFAVDVGQGDATLVLGPVVDGGRISLLIDAGGLEPDGGEILLEIFEGQGLSDLDYLIVSHFDGDHMGGLVGLWETSTSILWDSHCHPSEYFPTQAILDLGDSSKDTLSVQEYLSCRDANGVLLAEGHIEVGGTNIGYEIDLGGGYVATIVAGHGYVIGSAEQVNHVDTDNEKSIAVLITGPNGFVFLVTGDLTGAVYGNEDALVEGELGLALQERGIEVTILRVGHHGSANASAADFLALINPEVSIVSVGDNSHGHPSCAALERLVQYSAKVYQTGEGSTDDSCLAKDDVEVMGGTIRILVDDGEYTIN